MSRLYGALLMLYPASFRAEFGAEMREIFRDRLAAASTSSARLGLWADAIPEVVANAIGAHMDLLRQDLAYAVRTLSRTPGFALTAILVTGIGVGANTAAFAVANAVFLRPFPYAEPGRLLKLWESSSEFDRNEASPGVYAHWARDLRSFESMGAWYRDAVNVAGTGDPARVQRAIVTPRLFATLGIPAERGRSFSTSDQGDAGAVVISHALWQTQYGADAAILGRRVLLDGVPRVIIGVMPERFDFPDRSIGLWTLVDPATRDDPDVSNTYWEVIGRLRPGVTAAQANAELRDEMRRLRAIHPDGLEGVDAVAIGMRDELSRQSRLLILAFSGAAGCVLLIACANLASLMIARAMRRRYELLIRAALGAGRERLVRQAVTESLVLALLGGAAGVAIAWLTLPTLVTLIPASFPGAQPPHLDGTLVLVALGIATLTGLASGVIPAWRAASRLELGGLRDGGRSGGGRSQRARSMLVATEVAASVALLLVAGLLAQALLRVQRTPAGFDARQVLVARTALTTPRYTEPGRRAGFYRDVLESVRRLPGVQAAGYITGLPMEMTGGIWAVLPNDVGTATARTPRASSRYVTPGLFEAMGVPLLRGRDVSDADRGDGLWVAVVSASFADRFWPGEDAIGKRFRFGDGVRTVVGIAGNVRVRGLERVSEPQVYLPYLQLRDTSGSSAFAPRDLVVRSALPQEDLAASLRSIVRRVDPEQPVSDVRPLAKILEAGTAARATQVRLVGAFAVIALLLACIGIHGLLSYAVTMRQHEIGVRLALGAQRSHVVRLVVGQASLLALAGLVPGVALAQMASHAMRSLLAGLTPLDPATFGAVAGLCLAMTTLGSVVPALRAVRVDPASALRAGS